MTRPPTTLERAYALARSGECASVTEVRARLKQEGYSDIVAQLYGQTITNALRKLCIQARATQAEVDPADAGPGEAT